MYISCDVSKGGPAEPEAGYVPNNPLFGLPLDSPQLECEASCNGCLSCQRRTPLPLPLVPISDIDCGTCFDATAAIAGDTAFAQGVSQVSLNSYSSDGNCASNYWSPDEMASTFPGLPPLDIDPLPSLFQFSPCGTSYNFSTNPHQASLSYIVHPHQMLLSPGNPNHSSSIGQQTTHNNTLGTLGQVYYYDATGNCNNATPTTAPTAITAPATPTIPTIPATTAASIVARAADSIAAPPSEAAISSCSSQHMSAVGPAAIYPTMSVNVSMNMTMHGYSTTDGSMPIHYSQWTPPPPSTSTTTSTPTPTPQNASASTSSSSSSVNVLYPSICMSPSALQYAANDSSPPFGPDGPHCLSVHESSATLDILAPLADSMDKNLMPLMAQHHPEETKRNFYMTPTKDTIESVEHTKSPTLLNDMNCDTRLLMSKTAAATSYDDEEDSNEEVSDNKLNICRLCGKTYARPSTLKTHLRTHSGERPYRCHSCNKSFSQAANLTAHVRTHTGQKPFRCPICDRRFSQSSSVTTHMRTHSGERPYRCSSCKKSFSDSSTLTKHLRIHSGEKPYQCKLCLLRFSQSGNLNRHMRVHATNSNASFVT